MDCNVCHEPITEINYCDCGRYLCDDCVLKCEGCEHKGCEECMVEFERDFYCGVECWE